MADQVLVVAGGVAGLSMIAAVSGCTAMSAGVDGFFGELADNPRAASEVAAVAGGLANMILPGAGTLLSGSLIANVVQGFRKRRANSDATAARQALLEINGSPDSPPLDQQVRSGQSLELTRRLMRENKNA